MTDVDEPPRVLIVEDHDALRGTLRDVLTRAGYEVFDAPDAESALRRAVEVRPHWVLLDLLLPDRDGLDVVRQLRAWTTTPIVVLSARASEADRVAALDEGADDFLAKPVGMDELLARARVVQRRSRKQDDVPVLDVGWLRCDRVRRTVTVDAREVHVTPIEYALLLLLAERAGQVVAKDAILRAVWGEDCAEKSAYVHVYVQHLRAKIELDPRHPDRIVTVPGVGYRLRGT